MKAKEHKQVSFKWNPTLVALDKKETKEIKRKLRSERQEQHFSSSLPEGEKNATLKSRKKIKRLNKKLRNHMDEIQERSPLQLHFIASSPDAVFESSNLSYDFRSYVKAEEYKNVYI